MLMCSYGWILFLRHSSIAATIDNKTMVPAVLHCTSYKTLKKSCVQSQQHSIPHNHKFCASTSNVQCCTEQFIGFKTRSPIYYHYFCLCLSHTLSFWAFGPRIEKYEIVCVNVIHVVQPEQQWKATMTTHANKTKSVNNFYSFFIDIPSVRYRGV